MPADHLDLPQTQTVAVHGLLSLDHPVDGGGQRNLTLGTGLLDEYQIGGAGTSNPDATILHNLLDTRQVPGVPARGVGCDTHGGAVASSSPPSLIGTALDAGSLRTSFAAAMSTEQVARGKPAPDIYLAVADQLGRPPERCAAVEDCANGLRSAATAGLQVIAIPHPRYPPDPDALDAARLVLTGLSGLTPSSVAALAG